MERNGEVNRPSVKDEIDCFSGTQCVKMKFDTVRNSLYVLFVGLQQVSRRWNSGVRAMQWKWIRCKYLVDNPSSCIERLRLNNF